MYWLIIALLIGAGLWLVVQGIEHDNHNRTIVGAGIILVTLAFFGLMSLQGEMLWNEAQRLQERIWNVLTAHVGTVIAGAAVAATIIMLLIWSMESRLVRWFALFAAVVGTAWWGTQNWPEVLVVLRRVKTGMIDPVFGHDVALFMFALPL